MLILLGVFYKQNWVFKVHEIKNYSYANLHGNQAVHPWPHSILAATTDTLSPLVSGAAVGIGVENAMREIHSESK